MKVLGFEILGTAKSWAERWFADAPLVFVAADVERWAEAILSCGEGGVGTWNQPYIPHRLADALLKKGKKLGFWSFDPFARRWRTEDVIRDVQERSAGG